MIFEGLSFTEHIVILFGFGMFFLLGWVRGKTRGYTECINDLLDTGKIGTSDLQDMVDYLNK